MEPEGGGGKGNAPSPAKTNGNSANNKKNGVDNVVQGVNYFDRTGKYLGTDTKAKTNDIRILKEGKTLHDYKTQNGKMDRNGMIKDSSIITEIDFSSEESKKALANIGGYYNEKLGFNSKVLLSAEKGLLKIAHADHKKNQITLTLNNEGKINSLHDKYNFMSNSLHEKLHKNKNTRVTQPQGALNHLEAYDEQLQSSTWDKVTADYKDLTTRNIGYYLGYVNPISKRSELEKHYSNKFNIQFIKYSQYPEDVQYKIIK